MTWQEEREAQRRAEQEAKAREGFERWRDFLHLAEFGYVVDACNRVREACWDVLEYRRTFNQTGASGEQAVVATRVAADTFASEIEAAATSDQDTATIRWVVAGLRCSMRPFCKGCPACFTPTSPLRHGASR